MNKKRFIMLSAMTVMGAALALTSCTDSNYDWSDIDATIGLGGDTLRLPVNNSTNEIQLADILDLDTTGGVKIMPNGDYAIRFDETAWHTATTTIKPLTMNDRETYTGETYLDFSGAASAKQHRASTGLTFSSRLCQLRYDFTDVPDEIVALDYAGTDATIKINISFAQGIRRCVSSIATLSIGLPAFVDVERATWEGHALTVNAANEVTLTDVRPANGDVTLTIIPRGINLTRHGASDEVVFNRGQRILVSGYVTVGGTITAASIDAAHIPTEQAQRRVTASLLMDDVTVSDVTGRFCPKYNFTNLGDIDLTRMPDFITDHEVVADLYNPYVDLQTENNLPIDVNVTADLVARNQDGGTMVNIHIPEFKIQASDPQIISLRRLPGISDADTTVVVVNEMGQLLRTIPRTIDIPVIRAVGDDARTSSITLGHTYQAQTLCHFYAPLAFSDSAQIVYSDTLDGWNSTVKHLRFMEREVNGQTIVDGAIRLEVDVDNCVPAYLILNAYGIDRNGNRIATDRLAIDVAENIDPSPNGTTQVTTHETITLRPVDNSVFADLNGVILRFTAASHAKDKSPITGIRLNAHHQKLRLRNITAVKEGRLMGDFN